MSLKEKQCPYCENYFLYEDQLDGGLVDNSGEKITGHCPKCVDPHSIRGETYEKDSILSSLKRHFNQKGIDASDWDKDSLVEALRKFPKAYDLYFSNGTYRTITLYTGTAFDGRFGQFVLGPVIQRTIQNQPKPIVLENRLIICCRCNNQHEYGRVETLDMYTGFIEKMCKSCDAIRYIGKHKRNVKGLKKGSDKSDNSLRAKAKALNVSRSELRNNPNIEYHPPLPIGEVVNGLEIIEAFFDEKTYTPKYKLSCPKCGGIYIITQRKVEQISHVYCKETSNVSNQS